MLLGRDVEIARIAGLLDGAREHRSAALIVHGEAGVGKTFLLDHLDLAGFTILRAQPLQAEAELPFAGLHELVRPVEQEIGRLPEPQRLALAGALALGPPAPGDRFAVGAATLSLLAEAGPVVVLVDDAHWLDVPSREALLFAGRRLAEEGVVLLLVMRHREWVDRAGIETLELSGLAPGDASALIDSTGEAIGAAVRRRLIDETLGNPLAILEALREGGLLGSAPLAVGEALEQSFARHLDGLPEVTRRALLIAATSDTGDTGELARAGLDLTALEPAERAELVVVTAERVSFRHPLIRSAAYHVRDPAERRAAHQAFADALGRGPRAAWHRAAAADGQDEAIAAELEAAGAGALERSGYAAAASAFEAAAALSPGDPERLRRTLGAGRALWLGGEPEQAATLLEGALDLATEPAARADLQQLRAAAILFTRPVTESYTLLVAEAARIAPHDGARAAAMYANASLACVSTGDPVGADECARLAAASDPGSFAATILAPAMSGVAAAFGGRIAEARSRLRPTLDRLRDVEARDELFPLLTAVAWALSWIEDWTLAETAYRQMLDAARATGAPSLLPMPLAALTELEFRRGRIAAAYAAASESVQLSRETGQTLAAAYGLVMLARTEAVLGHEDSCREHANTALELARRSGSRAVESFCAGTLGLLDLSYGRPQLVVERLAGHVRTGQEYGVVPTTITEWSADLVEACVRSGDMAAAGDAAAVLEGQARGTQLRWPRAADARCRALLSTDGFEDDFGAALDLLGTDMTFERARTQLCLGIRRRRGRRRVDARVPLREALEYFDAAGAEPWADQARAELLAAGDRAAPAGGGSLRSLTPQELQVAMIVADGATNREAAASLFLSEKTVEARLTGIYRKLGLRSRAELAARLQGS